MSHQSIQSNFIYKAHNKTTSLTTVLYNEIKNKKLLEKNNHEKTSTHIVQDMGSYNQLLSSIYLLNFPRR